MSLIGKKAPEIAANAVVNGELSFITLKNYVGMYKLLFFYPLDFTFVCPTEMHALQEKLAAFHQRDVQVLAVSVDSVYSHLSWLNTPRSQGGVAGVQYPLVSDIHKKIARDYGVLNEDAGIAYRGVFLVDKNDVIQYEAINNLQFGRSIDELLRVVDAVQYAEKHGEVCPANWQPGEKTMKPDQHGLKQYFGQ